MEIAHDHVNGPFQDGLQSFQKEVKSNEIAKGNVEQSLSAGFLKRSNTVAKAGLGRTCCFAGKSCKKGFGI